MLTMLTAGVKTAGTSSVMMMAMVASMAAAAPRGLPREFFLSHTDYRAKWARLQGVSVIRPSHRPIEIACELRVSAL
ncbi:hypothetical protein BWK49_28565 (plasmid) [Mycobacterium intracellulare subsp. chimaera]|nr:hypothetical protein BWK49_28565 [Mycobacterium intracellulare subsp. chimaera]